MDNKTKTVLFVYNPHAGKGLIRASLSDIADVFTKAGYEVTVYPTQHAGDGYRKIIEDGSRYTLVCTSGGDGTLSEAVKAMMVLPEKTPLGYIPAGSTNDVAQSLNLPLKPSDCAKAIVTGVYYDYDVGSFNGENFVYVAAFGAFTSVSYATPQESKNMLGHAAYLVEAIKRVNEIRGYDLIIEHDGGVTKGNFVLGIVSNSISVGGMKNFVPEGVCFDDGLFEVCLIKTPTNPIELSSILADAAVNKLTNEKYFVTFKTSRLSIRSTEPIAWTLDGEAGGEHRKVEIINHKQAVRLKIGFNEITAEQEFSRMRSPSDRLLELSPEEYFRQQEDKSSKQ
ncbi:MAG: diacylglycerol kinase family lipid kinase [Ruminococcus sp.]|nr:diacylglycerol kinase family lipid kinase [Ruminococcus sp.]